MSCGGLEGGREDGWVRWGGGGGVGFGCWDCYITPPAGTFSGVLFDMNSISSGRSSCPGCNYRQNSGGIVSFTTA